MAALLTVYFDDAGKVTTFLAECKRLNIPILPPDVNYSQLDFDIQTQDDGANGTRRGVRFGMAAIKNAGVGALQHIIAEREANGAFTGLEDFCTRLDLRVVGKRTVESLIKVGALKSMGNRKQLIAALDRLMSFSGDHHKAKEVGQMGLFGEALDTMDNLLLNLPTVTEEVTQREMLNWEKELLGLYISSHPIDPLMEQLRGQPITSTLELKAEDARDEMPVTFVGLIAALRKIPTKNHDMMCVATLEDRFGTIDAVLFPRTWAKFMEMMVDGAVVKVMGKLDLKRMDPQIICERVEDTITSVTSAEDNSYSPMRTPASSTGFDDTESIGDDYASHSNGNGSSAEPPSLDDLPLSGYEDEWSAQRQPAPQQIDEDPPQMLRVRFIRNGDDAHDRRRLEHLIGTIKSYHGRDRFEIVIVTHDVDTHLMEFPHLTTNYCPALIEEIETFKNVKVVPRAGVS